MENPAQFRVEINMRVMRGDLRLGFRLRGEKGRPHLVEVRVMLEEATGHLRQTRDAAEIDNGAGMGDGLGPDRRGLGWRPAGGRSRPRRWGCWCG